MYLSDKKSLQKYINISLKEIKFMDEKNQHIASYKNATFVVEDKKCRIVPDYINDSVQQYKSKKLVIIKNVDLKYNKYFFSNGEDYSTHYDEAVLKAKI